MSGNGVTDAVDVGCFLPVDRSNAAAWRYHLAIIHYIRLLGAATPFSSDHREVVHLRNKHSRVGGVDWQ